MVGRYMIPPLKPKPTPWSMINCHTWRQSFNERRQKIVKTRKADLRREAGAKETREVEHKRTPHSCFHVFWVAAEHD